MNLLYWSDRDYRSYRIVGAHLAGARQALVGTPQALAQSLDNS
jgi:hypothetical protein